MERLWGKWTKEKCIEDAAKYPTLTEWKSNSSGAYESARRNGWLDECELKNLSLDECIASAIQFSTDEEWFLSRPVDFSIALEKGWLGICLDAMSNKKV